ncbi:cytochrome b [Aurantiacibacter marinus]|uniref:Cytochrome B561 n=1 Tax=Aurantiacibacter marinus TaxID=874156 RepID=A0A0H0XLD4_9SPHN|nr:cytochrome b [Aurantiacibacter marinus]KLI63174.1 cytochrome B561 [Aurantiacibacter marinus]
MSKHQRYSGVAMLFHWVIAGLVILNWRLAENAEHAAARAEKIAIFNDHKAVGITILALTIGRLAWRLSHPVPPLPSGYANWERILARSTHVIFYVLLIGLPIGGWLANSLGGQQIEMFGLFTIGALPVGSNEGLSEEIFDLHKTGGTIMIYLVGLHVLGGLKHTFFDKDGGIFRMLPFGKVGPRSSL